MTNTVIGKTKTNIPVQGSDNMSNIADNITVASDGSTTIKGPLTVSEYEFDQDITLSSLPTGLNCNYAHARISNGKLNIVISLYAESGVTIESIQRIVGSVVGLSADILAKLHATGTSNFLDSKVVYGGNTTTSVNPISIVLTKEETYLSVALRIPSITTDELSIWRFEFNFILSKEEK